MKKFFSLVLALVMALSLCGTAWAAAGTAEVTDDTGLSAALADTTVNTINLAAGEYNITGSSYLTQRENLTITGPKEAKITVKMANLAMLNAKNLTIDGVTILKSANWSHLNIGYNGSQVGFTYTIKNCYFTGVGTQGIYINAKDGFSYNIQNCTFSGDFGDEAAITIQNNTSSCNVNVSGNTFSNVESSVGVFGKDDNLNLTSDADVDLFVREPAYPFADAVAAADAGDTIKLMSDVTVTTPPVIDEPINIDANGQTLTGFVAGSNITTNDDGEITGGTFSDPAAAEPYLADDVILNAAGGVVAVPSTIVPSGGPTLAPSVDDMTVPQYAAWTAKLVAEDDADEKKGEFATYTIEMIAKVNAAPIWWASGVEEKGEDVDFVYGGQKEFVVVDPAAAEFVIVNGSTVTYLARANVYNTKGWDEKAVKVELPYAVADKYECDNFYATNPAATTFYKFANTMFVACAKADSTIVFNVDGLAVPAKAATTEVAYKDHTYKMDSQGNTYGEKKLTKVYCGVCGDVFDFVVGDTTDAVLAFGVNNYADTKLDWPTTNGKNVYIRTGYTLPSVPSVGGSSTPSTDKVTSAETFDAGIAMYVGMSVMAAAGSVVVLKKRED